MSCGCFYTCIKSNQHYCKLEKHHLLSYNKIYSKQVYKPNYPQKKEPAMRNISRLGDMVTAQLRQSYRLEREDLGSDAHLSKKGMVFDTESYRIPGLGHFCLMRMNAMLGLMKMETAVLAATEKDAPLLNLDWVRAFGKETQIVELYDTQLTSGNEEALAEFDLIRRRDDDIPDIESKPHWYDSILYPCSYHKAGKGITERLSAAAEDYMKTFLRQLETAPTCDSEAKAEKVKAFAGRLFAEGGPAVDQVTKLFGRDTAKRLILRWMYGADS